MAPSQNSTQNHETLSTFLQNIEFRKLYNQLLTSIRKYKFLEANNWFLSKCLEEKIIPKSFRVKNKAHNSSKEFENRWTDTTNLASLELIKITLEKDSEKEKVQLEEVTSQLNVLIILAPNEQTKDELKFRCKNKADVFKTAAMRNKFKKIKWLSNSSNVTLACSDDEQSETHKTHVTLACEDGQQIKAPKDKKRKWIKKSKYQRIQRQKKKQKISVVFNYSKITLTNGMEKVLNRGLNFSITPLNLNITQVLVDFSRFACDRKHSIFFSTQNC